MPGASLNSLTCMALDSRFALPKLDRKIHKAKPQSNRENCTCQWPAGFFQPEAKVLLLGLVIAVDSRLLGTWEDVPRKPPGQGKALGMIYRALGDGAVWGIETGSHMQKRPFGELLLMLITVASLTDLAAEFKAKSKQHGARERLEWPRS